MQVARAAADLVATWRSQNTVAHHTYTNTNYSVADHPARQDKCEELLEEQIHWTESWVESAIAPNENPSGTAAGSSQKQSRKGSQGKWNEEALLKRQRHEHPHRNCSGTR